LLHLSDYRGGGIYKDYENGKQLWDEFVEFTVIALNEKWERDFGEPLRWLKRRIEETESGHIDYNKCPKCGWDDIDIGGIEDCAYCPHCGQRLGPPEKEQSDQTT
jgi:hypothetical protein